MADRDVKVTIQGNPDPLKKAAAESETALGRLTDRVATLAKGFAALVVGGAVANFFKESVQEAMNAEKGLARLGVAVTNTGNDFKQLSPVLEQAVKSVQRMSTATDDDLREALTRMISVSGDVKGSMANLAVVADLAAYKQISVADAADIVAKAMAGNFTALNKMGIAGKDATTVMENLRAAVGGQAEAELKTFGGAVKGLTNQWGEFKEAIGTAILSGGGMADTAGTLTGKLAELEDWVVQNASTIGAFANAVAGAVGWLVKATVAVVDWVQKAGIEAATIWMSVGPAFKQALGGMLQAMGDFLGQNRALLFVFGDGLTTVADGMANTGARMQREAIRALGFVKQAHDEAYAGLKSTATKGENEVTDVAIAAGTRRVDAAKKQKQERVRTHQEEIDELVKTVHKWTETVKKEADEGKKIFKDLGTLATDALGPSVQTAIAATAAEIDQMAERALELYKNGRITKEEFEQILRRVRDLKAALPALVPLSDDIAESARLAGDYWKAVNDNTAKTKPDLATIARTAIDLGDTFGLLDDRAKSVLTSIINIGSNLKAALGGDIGSILGVLGGVGSILGALFSGGDRREALTEANTRALERLTREVGNFNLGATGRTFQGVESAVAAGQQAFDEFAMPPESVLAQNPQMRAEFIARRNQAAFAAFKRQLLASGVSLEDADAMLKELGFDALGSAGEFGASLPFISEGLGKTEFGQVGQDFESQYDATLTGFDINNISNPREQFAQLADLARRFSPALAAALASDDPLGALRGLWEQMRTGGLSPQDFGNLNASQFLSILKRLLDLGASASISGLDLGGIDKPAGGLPDVSPSLGSIASADELATALPVLGGGAAGTVIGTQITGDVHVTVVVPEREDARETAALIAEEVDRLFEERRVQLAAAAGSAAI